MEYSANILRHEPAFYTLVNASLHSGILTIGAGGSASTTLTKETNISRLTEYFRLSIVAQPFSATYVPTIRVKIHIVTTDGDVFNDTLFPVDVSNGVYTVELHYTASEYAEFTFKIESDIDTVISLWELCPEAASDDITTIIEGVEQSLPRLLFDYNTLPLVVGQRETTVGLITCNLIDATDLQGHFTINYIASAAGRVTLRFKDNESTELFAPLTYDITSGRGNIGVPHSYLHRLAGYHNFMVTAQVSSGQLSVGTRGVLYTIDGGYLAERIIDIGSNVCDITLERKSTDKYAPSNIWIVGLEAGELLVRSRPYNASSSGVAFTPKYSLGPGKDGAIEFDGDWYLEIQDNDTKYRLGTYEQPMCFIIDNDNKLFVQTGGDATTRIQLDDSVDSVSVCRGFKSMLYVAQDQGLVCAYVKNKRVYYRAFAYDSSTSEYIWQGAIEVTDFVGNAKHVHVHRLNDYRLGFAVTTEDENYWLITDRTYVGQSFGVETFEADSLGVTTAGLFKADDLPDAIEVTCTISDNRKSVTAEFNYDVRFAPAFHNSKDMMLKYINVPAGLDIVDVVVQGRNITFNFAQPVESRYDIILNEDTTFWQYKFKNTYLAMPSNITIVVDPYRYLHGYHNETFAVSASVIEATISLTVAGDTRGYVYDTASFTPSVDADFELKAVTELVVSEQSETVSLNISNVITSVVLLQVGESPI